jgi:hypothetical protein
VVYADLTEGEVDGRLLEGVTLLHLDGRNTL